jgi:hypothetical protein
LKKCSRVAGGWLGVSLGFTSSQHLAPSLWSTQQQQWVLEMVMLHMIALDMKFTHIKQGVAPKVKLQNNYFLICGMVI